MNCQRVIEDIYEGKPLTEHTIRIVYRKLSQILVEESNLLHIKAPLIIVGDIHGQLFDLQKLLTIGSDLFMQVAL